MTQNIVVVGGGVIGLSSALCLCEVFPECHVTVISAEYYPARQGITSIHGFGIVGIRRDGLNYNTKNPEWLAVTKDYCSKMHPMEAEMAGIRPLDALMLFHEEGSEGLNGVLSERSRNLQKFKPADKKQAEEVAHLSNDHVLETLFPPLNPNSKLNIFTTSTYVIDSSLFLPWLKNKLKSLKDSKGKPKVSFRTRDISSLNEVVGDFDLVVNCAGLNAGKIANDPNVFPIRGQYYSVEKTSDIDKVFAARETVICPRVNDTVLGGVYQKDRTDTETDPDDAADILRRCEALVPAVKGAKILGQGVGVRPARYGGARVELEWWPRDPKLSSGIRNHPKTCPVIHNYGHGGAGFAVHRGCALDVARLAREVFSRTSKL